MFDCVGGFDFGGLALRGCWVVLWGGGSFEWSVWVRGGVLTLAFPSLPTVAHSSGSSLLMWLIVSLLWVSWVWALGEAGGSLLLLRAMSWVFLFVFGFFSVVVVIGVTVVAV